MCCRGSLRWSQFYVVLRSAFIWHVVLGITSRRSACTARNAIVVVANRDTDSVVLTTAHEVGHALGAPHDGDDTSVSCSADAHLLMNPDAGTKRLPIYSGCAKSAIKAFLTRSASCLKRRRCPSSAIPKNEQQEMMNEHCKAKVKETEDFLNATVLSLCVLNCYTKLHETVEVASLETSAPDWWIVDTITCAR
ncbi:uncharacterized protein LOC142790080 [Rhipicephalus microplus]|uniref:uncharacterized protein LOC142790080 n=1 Tax=Rhipicephalus microplus TaxID=6941 RepID=UPI003F6BECA4